MDCTCAIAVSLLLEEAPIFTGPTPSPRSPQRTYLVLGADSVNVCLLFWSQWRAGVCACCFSKAV